MCVYIYLYVCVLNTGTTRTVYTNWTIQSLIKNERQMHLNIYRYYH